MIHSGEDGIALIVVRRIDSGTSSRRQAEVGGFSSIEATVDGVAQCLRAKSGVCALGYGGRLQDVAPLDSS